MHAAPERDTGDHARQRARLTRLWALGVLVHVLAGSHVAVASDAVSFVDEVAPILIEHCLVCHAGDTREGGFDISTVGGLRQAGDSGRAGVVPGKSDQSELLGRLVTDDETLRMPLDGPPLDEDQIAIIRRWIDEGAEVGELPDTASLDGLSGGAMSNRSMVRATPPQRYPRSLPVTAVALAGENAEVVVSAGYGELLCWDVDSGDLLGRIDGLAPYVAQILWRPGDESSQGALVVWHGVPGQVGYLTRITLDGWQAAERQELHTTADVEGAIAISPDGRRMAVGHRDGVVEILDLPTAQVAHRLNLHADAVLDLAYMSGGEFLLTASRDRTARTIRLEDLRPVGSYVAHERAAHGVAATELGPVTIEETGTLRLWPREGENARTSRDGFLGSHLRLTTLDEHILVAVENRLHRVEPHWVEIEDGKDDEGNPKTRRVPRFRTAPPLIATDADTITSVNVGAEGSVAVGTHGGDILVWRGASDAEAAPPAKRFRALPE